MLANFVMPLFSVHRMEPGSLGTLCRPMTGENASVIWYDQVWGGLNVHITSCKTGWKILRSHVTFYPRQSTCLLLKPIHSSVTIPPSPSHICPWIKSIVGQTNGHLTLDDHQNGSFRALVLRATIPRADWKLKVIGSWRKFVSYLPNNYMCVHPKRSVL